MGGDDGAELRILVVDDQPQVLRSMKYLLERVEPLDVLLARTVIEAEELLRSAWPIHGAVLDVQLGKGTTALDLLRGWPWHFQAMRVLVYTGGQDDGVSAAVHALGGTYAHKPVEIENMVKLVSAAREVTVERAILQELAGANLTNEDMTAVVTSMAARSRRDAAEELGISDRALKRKLDRALERIHASSIDALRLRVIARGAGPIRGRMSGPNPPHSHSEGGAGEPRPSAFRQTGSRLSR
jgi:DNA-binding NarL/FixJ family response regulator